MHHFAPGGRLGRLSFVASLSLILCLATAAAVVAQTPLIVGEYVHDVRRSAHPYPGNEAETAQLVHSETIQSPGATYIAPHFAKFDLAEGDYLIVRSPDGDQSWTYTGYGRGTLGLDGGFFATHIKGDTAIIELYSQSRAGGYGFLIDYFGRGFNDAEIADMWLNGVDEKVNLPEPFFADNRSICTAGDWAEAGDVVNSGDSNLIAAHTTSRAVVRLLQNGSAHCTGWLVGDEGHVMTNEHCIGSQSQANNIDFEFMAEAAAGVNCQSSLACGGTIEASGSTLVQNDAPLDYALVLPTTLGGTTPPDLVSSYGRFQLRDTAVSVGERVFHPQHPAGWGKQIVYQSTYPSDGDPNGDIGGFPGNTVISSIGEAACSAGGPAEIGYWTDTQGGSSGSPVVAWSDHKVVALHHCRGSAFCTSGNPASDDRNRGVPIPEVILDLGVNLPSGATCDAPPVPVSVSATGNGDNQIDVSWAAGRGVANTYDVERALGTCAANSGFSTVASGVEGLSHSDTTVSGLTDYAYRIKAYDPVEDCRSLASTCADASTTGVCTLPPDFGGIADVMSAGTESCGTTVSWSAASLRCGTSLVYNVYRSLTPDFEPAPGNLVASCQTGTSWEDNDVMPGLEYYYTVRSEDDSGNGTGPCGGGNEDTNSIEMSAVPAGPPISSFSDDVEAGGANFTTASGPGGGAGTPFSIVDTDANSPTHSWFVADEPFVKDEVLSTSSGISLPASGGALLTFWHHYDTESNWDGAVLEISTDGGSNWVDILDGNAGRFLAGGYASNLNNSSNPLGGRAAWHGDSGDFIETVVDLDDFAGQTIHLRWRMGCDSSVSDVGWWVDDFEVTTATACTGENIFTDGFESGDTSAWSLANP